MINYISKHNFNILLFLFLFAYVFNSTLGNFLDLPILGVEYIPYALLIIFIFIINIKRGFRLPKHYFPIFLIFLIFLIVTSYLSPYVPRLPYVIMASLVTICPFITFMFFYNLNLQKHQIIKMLNSIVNVSVILLIIEVASRFLNFDWFKSGGFSSCMSIILIVSSLVLNNYTPRKKYNIFILLGVFVIFFFGQLKSLISLIVIVGLYFNAIGKLKFAALFKYLFYIGVLVLAIYIVFPAFADKIALYFDWYIFGENRENMPRNAIYIAAFKIAADYFPFGSGQGTFGSAPVSIFYSDVYYDYNLSHIHGLHPIQPGEASFLMDTHWASILGECGYIGIACYLIMVLYPLIRVRSRKFYRKLDFPLYFMIVAVLVDVLIEGVALALPNQIFYILIYSGLAAILLRYFVTSEKLYKLDRHSFSYENPANK